MTRIFRRICSPFLICFLFGILFTIACHSPVGPSDALLCVSDGEKTFTDGRQTVTATVWVSPVPGMNCKVPKTNGPTVDRASHSSTAIEAGKRDPGVEISEYRNFAYSDIWRSMPEQLNSLGVTL